MTWPTTGTNGWEVFGTEITTLPIAYPLPVPAKAYYYDPVRLHGIGALCESVVLIFADGTCVVRHRRVTSEALFTLTNVWDDALLDMYVLEPLGAPCSLVLDIYDDDRTTILWSVGTDPAHAVPLLVEPSSYAEQEIDVAAGAASLGTVTVEVVDKAIIPGDQDSGWLTGRLAVSGLAYLAGRRCRLRRFISEDLGWIVLADGPAGPPRLDSSYSAFTWDIRDTRETERKISLFIEGIEQSLLPEGNIEGYGGLIAPLLPMTGTYDSSTLLAFVDVTGETTARRTMSYASYVATQKPWAHYVEAGRPENYNHSPIWLKWRAAGSSDPWVELRESLVLVVQPSSPATLFDFSSALRPEGSPVIVGSVNFWTNPESVSLVPTNGQSIEFYLMGMRGVPPTTEVPLTIDGLTAGQLLMNIYEGLYSARGENGAVVPTGIRYDPLALLPMDDPVRMHITEAIDDARDWTEKYIYAPTGWVPALNDLGEISPVSQVAPAGPLGLQVLDNAIVEASPDWNSGERVINILRFIYPRDYIPTDPELAETGDGLAARSVLMEFRDDISVARYGEQILELDGSAFRAIGDAEAEPLTTVDNELAYQLGFEREMHLFNRYAMGAPTISFAVMRDPTTGLRAGSWVVLDLSWLPDYVTQRRGLIGLAQVTAIGDLDCKWRRLMLEVVTPFPAPGS
jgi:hypothetical protein